MAENLNLAAFVFEVNKHAGVADGHGAAGYGNTVFCISTGRKVFIFVLQISRVSIGLEAVRVGVIVSFFQGMEFGQARIAMECAFYCHNFSSKFVFSIYLSSEYKQIYQIFNK